MRHWCTAWVLIGSSLLISPGCDTTVRQSPAPAPPAAQPATLEAPIKAEAGVGKQGQSLRNEKGVGRMIAQPAISLFAVKQRVVFEIQIPQAMELYKASNGNYPKSHQDFMTHIIKANNIPLPALPEGQEYKYHPDEGQLWVHPIGQ